MAARGESSEASFAHAVRALGASLLGIARTRLELAGLEVEGELILLAQLVAAALAAALFAALALVVLSFLAVYAVEPSERTTVLGVLGAAYALLALGLVLWMRQLLRHRPPFLGATLAEIEKDRRALAPEPLPAEGPGESRGPEEAGVP